jgi:tetratricopeptide (TPR) repeat protein
MCHERLGERLDARKCYEKGLAVTIVKTQDEQLHRFRAEAETLLRDGGPSATRPATAASQPSQFYSMQMRPIDEGITAVSKQLEEESDEVRRASLLAKRGKLYARRGRFAEAATDFSKGIELNPQDHWNWYYRGCLLAYLGQDRTYRDHCRAMLQRFGGSDEREIADRTAKTCLLVADPADPGQLLALAERALARADGNQNLESWFSLGKSFALYRLGRFPECLDWADRCITIADGDQAARTVATTLLQALAHHRLGRGAEAKAAMQRAVNRMEQEMPKPGQEDLDAQPWGIENWLIANTLRREAERL